ncbi:hypothetical protein AYI69_g5454 [Smittium culicis]|uniref:Uncharacterized protein n=1 Tax=Smittium culicis TaxID=133412 RepID=A0A1R1Y5M1_9FUNG|nr:hypothetical protein AYI69_g5454 [Smittium culicis]
MISYRSVKVVSRYAAFPERLVSTIGFSLTHLSTPPKFQWRALDFLFATIKDWECRFRVVQLLEKPS